MSKQVKYTRITLKNLVMEARNLGIEVSFTTDMDGNYVINHKIVSTVPAAGQFSTARDGVYHPESCAMACWMIKGMIAQAKTILCGLNNLNQINRTV